MNEKSKIIWKPIDELIPYEHNAKEHNETQIKNIAQSIQELGWQQPVLIDKDNVIIAGHGRILAAKSLGKDKAPCLIADDLTDEQVKKYRILDNKLNESDWIYEELEFKLPDIDFDGYDLDFDVKDCDWTDEELEKLMDSEVKKTNKNNYNVVVKCDDESTQKKVVNLLSKNGYICKV